MKTENTIIGAALKVLETANQALSVQEIYEEIVSKSLYTFHAQDPLSVVRVELRKHAYGINFPSASKKKYFVYNETNGRFSPVRKESETTFNENIKLNHLSQVRILYNTYLKDFKSNILAQLKKMNAYDFEKFCMQLLKVYGFINMDVTQKSRDGGN